MTPPKTDAATRPGRRARRHGSEAGAASLETVGVAIIAAILAVGVLLSVTPQARVLGETAAYAICQVVTFGQGSCTPPSNGPEAHVPEEPCVVSQDGVERNMKIAVVVFTTEDGRRIEVQELSNGEYRVTVTDSGSVGAETGIGGGLSITVNDVKVGANASAGAGVSIDIKAGDVYHADQDSIGNLMNALLHDQIKDALVGDSGPIRWLTDRGTGLLGIGDSLPDPDATYAEGGISFNASVEATGLTSSIGAGVEGATMLGVKRDRDGTTTVYLETSIEGEAGLHSFGGDGILPAHEGGAVEGSAQVVTAVTFDKDGNMIQVQATSVAAGGSSGIATALFGGSGDPSMGNSQSQATVYQATLNLRDPADHAAAQQYLLTQGIGALGGWTNPLAMAAGVQAQQSFFEAAGDRGTITQQTYDTDSSTVFGFDASGKLGVELGASADVKTDSMDTVGAQYWDGTKWVEWADCAA